VQNKPDRQALEAYLRRFPDGPHASLAKQRLESIGASTVRAPTSPTTPSKMTTDTLETRMKATDDLFDPKEYKFFAHIIAAREGQEDVIIGRRDDGEYFKATVQSWTRIDPEHLDTVPQVVKDDLNTKISHPLVWLINKESLRDKDYDAQYNRLLNQTRLALFGTIPGTVIVTAYDRIIPPAKMTDADGKLVPSLFAFYSLMATSPNLDAVTPPPKPVVTPTLPAANHGDLSFKTISKTTDDTGSQTPARVYSYDIKGAKMRVENGNTTLIIDFAAQTSTSFDNVNKTFTVRNLNDFSANPDAGDIDRKFSYWFDPHPKILMKETGKKRTVNTFNASEVVMTIVGMHSPEKKIQMEIEMWVSADIHGSAELREFYRKHAGELPQTAMGFPWDTILGGGSAGARAALADAQRKMASMDGVVIEEVVRVKEANRWYPFAPMDSSDFSTKDIPDSVFATPSGYQRTALGAPR
jgi:hypothetical protein